MGTPGRQPSWSSEPRPVQPAGPTDGQVTIPYSADSLAPQPSPIKGDSIPPVPSMEPMDVPQTTAEVPELDDIVLQE